MGYEAALNKAWGQLQELGAEGKIEVGFLADKYEVDLRKKQVYSLSCNAASVEYIGILILHYLIQKLKGLPRLTQEWISFQQLSGGKGYYDAFRKRAIEPVIRKYGRDPKSLLNSLERLPGKKIQYGDSALLLDVFEGVPVMVTVWGQDVEFSAEANIIFDRSISSIFATEDIAVLSGIVSKQL